MRLEKGVLEEVSLVSLRKTGYLLSSRGVKEIPGRWCVWRNWGSNDGAHPESQKQFGFDRVEGTC